MGLTRTSPKTFLTTNRLSLGYREFTGKRLMDRASKSVQVCRWAARPKGCQVKCGACSGGPADARRVPSRLRRDDRWSGRLRGSTWQTSCEARKSLKTLCEAPNEVDCSRDACVGESHFFEAYIAEIQPRYSRDITEVIVLYSILTVYSSNLLRNSGNMSQTYHLCTRTIHL